MIEKICYEFEGFRLDPFAQSLSFAGEPISLRPIAFQLLLVLVENHGHTLTKSEIIRRVWGTDDDLDADNKFHVTLRAVRQALESSEPEDAAKKRLIVRDANGYRLTATVREVSRDESAKDRVPKSVPIEQSRKPVHYEMQIVQSVSAALGKHLTHIVVSCALYAALYGSAVFIEIAYQFDRYGRSAFKIWPLVFCWIMISSIAALLVNQKMSLQDRRGGLIVSVLVLFMAAGVVYESLTVFLPSVPITQATFRTYPAQAAYLKDTVYFLVLVLFFLILPFHFVTTMEREIGRGRYRAVLGILTSLRWAVLPKGTIYPKFWAMTLLLLLFAVMSIEMTAHLLDNLEPGAYGNLFIVLVYLRGILYFGLGVECLAWYYNALGVLKSECIDRLDSR
jgi:DNA-binding winged helix-turn-helix (wHTH) protein